MYVGRSTVCPTWVKVILLVKDIDRRSTAQEEDRGGAPWGPGEVPQGPRSSPPHTRPVQGGQGVYLGGQRVRRPSRGQNRGKFKHVSQLKFRENLKEYAIHLINEMEVGFRDYATNFKDLNEVSLRVPSPSRRQDQGYSQPLSHSSLFISLARKN